MSRISIQSHDSFHSASSVLSPFHIRRIHTIHRTLPASVRPNISRSISLSKGKGRTICRIRVLSDIVGAYPSPPRRGNQGAGKYTACSWGTLSMDSQSSHHIRTMSPRAGRIPFHNAGISQSARSGPPSPENV